jgi:hypothetical protein
LIVGSLKGTEAWLPGIQAKIPSAVNTEDDPDRLLDQAMASIQRSFEVRPGMELPSLALGS